MRTARPAPPRPGRPAPAPRVRRAAHRSGAAVRLPGRSGRRPARRPAAARPGPTRTDRSAARSGRHRPRTAPRPSARVRAAPGWRARPARSRAATGARSTRCTGPRPAAAGQPSPPRGCGSVPATGKRSTRPLSTSTRPPASTAVPPLPRPAAATRRPASRASRPSRRDRRQAPRNLLQAHHVGLQGAQHVGHGVAVVAQVVHVVRRDPQHARVGVLVAPDHLRAPPSGPAATVAAAAAPATEQPSPLAREVGGADQPGLVAQLGADQRCLRPEPATGQVPAEGLAGRAEQQLAGLADPAADHEQPGVERGGEVRDADAQPTADVVEQLLARPGRRPWPPG